ncbi:DUF2285 domain-containing protein [Aliidongia dinghuensis]|nr:DUF2285 domain-containing protein [Aliidongia dinghuensis]
MLRIERLGLGDGAEAVLLPLDQLFETRVAAALRLWRMLCGHRPGPNPSALTAQAADRLILALRALDGKLDGATQFEIATALFRPRNLTKRDWIDHDLRDRTGRLVRLGLRLMNGGYRRLLLHPFRRRI